MAEGESNANMVEEEEESNDIMVEEEEKLNASMEKEGGCCTLTYKAFNAFWNKRHTTEKYSNASMVQEEGESNASMVQEEGKSNASMVQEEGKSNASMVQEEGKSKASMVQEEGKSNASMVQEEGESNASMVQEEAESNVSMVKEEGESNASMDEEVSEEDYSLRSLYDSEGESNASMVKEDGQTKTSTSIVEMAISLHAQPDEVVSSPDNALPSSVNQLVNTSVSTQAVLSEPTDAEAQNLAGDSSDEEMNTSTSFGEIAISVHAQPDEVVSSPDNAFPSSVNQLVNTSVIAQAVSSEPTDAEAQNLAGDSSDGEMNTSTSFEEIVISLHAQPDKVVSSPDNALPSSVDQLVNTSVIAQAVSSEPTDADAEAQNLAGDSSAVSPRTQPSEGTFQDVRASTVPLDDPTDAEPAFRSGDFSDAEPDTSRDDSMSDMSLIGSTSVSLSNKPLENSDEELENLIDQMPPELRIKPVHCLILCTKEDIDGADKFKEHLIRDIKIKHGPVTAVLDKGPEFISLPGAIFSRADECINRGILKFIYMTENLIKDKKMLLTIESCFSESFNHEHKKWTFFPVYSRKEDKKLPFPSFLKSLPDIDYFNPDKHYRNNIASLIEDRNSVFVKENEHLKNRQKEWITENRKTGAATGGIQETQMKSVSIPGLDTDNKKRWHTVGLCLNIVVLSTALKHVGPLIEKEFNDLEISEKTKDNFLKKHRKTPLTYKSYKVINGNSKLNPEDYDYNIRNAVDFSKCLVNKQAHKYTDFNDCKLETWLYFLTDIDLPSITEDCRKSAKKVVDIRNKWAHCAFSEWTDDFYRNALSLIEELLKNLELKPEEENRFLGDLEEMKDHCRNLIHGITCDLSFWRDLLNKTVELLKCVTEDKIVKAEIVKIIESLQSVLDTFIG